jgi:VWFA-related protein
MLKKIFPLLLIFIFLSFVHGLQSQKKPIQPERHEVTVRLVLVDVIAIDKDGDVVTDLTKEDFEVFEDGKKIHINSLDFIDFKRPEKAVPEMKREVPRKKRFFVIFDSINTVKRMLDRSRSQILDKLISLVKLGGEIMIYDLNRKDGLKLLQPFTSNEELIAQAVDKASGSIWVERAADTLSVPSIIAASKARENFEQSARETYQFETRSRFEKSLTCLLSFMNRIKDYPGRKPVLLISGGFPSVSFDKFFAGPNIADTAIARAEVSAAKIMDPFKVLQKDKRRQGSEIFNDLIHFANSYNITFYTLDPDNYLRYVLPDMEYDSFQRIVDIAEIKRDELSNLKYMAADTGGETFQGAKKFDNFQAFVSRDLTSYYELSYYPEKKEADGKYHSIQVKVKRPGVKIRFRKGYYDYNLEQRESLLFASTSANPALFKQISFQARAVPFIKNKDKCILWINMALPAQTLILGGDPGKESKIIKVNLWVDDKQDKKAFSAQFNIPLALTPSFRERLQNARYFGYNTCTQEIKLKHDEYNVIFSLYDEESGQVGTVEQEFESPVLKNDGEANVINIVFGRLVESRKDGKSFTISPQDGTLRVDRHLFFPMGSNQFRNRQDISLFIQVYSPIEKPEFAPQFSLFQNGRELGDVPGEVFKESWNKKAKISNLLFNLNFSRYPRGIYLLNIKLVDSLNNQILHKDVEIRII